MARLETAVDQLYNTSIKKSIIVGPDSPHTSHLHTELLVVGVPLKQFQEWLGHSDMSTTANIYSHLDAVTKEDTGAAMSQALG